MPTDLASTQLKDYCRQIVKIIGDCTIVVDATHNGEKSLQYACETDAFSCGHMSGFVSGLAIITDLADLGYPDVAEISKSIESGYLKALITDVRAYLAVTKDLKE